MCVHQGKVNATDPVEAVAYNTFKKLNLETTLSKLNRVLDTEHFALVVHNQRLCKYYSFRGRSNL